MSADRVAPKLWMGSAPPTDRALADRGFDVVVLAAKEYQPHGFRGIEVIRVPMDDAQLSDREAWAAYDAASQVVAHLRAGRRVLVTCMMGLNRSGLITALALKGLGVPEQRAIAMVRGARGPRALHNRSFVREILHSRGAMVVQPKGIIVVGG